MIDLAKEREAFERSFLEWRTHLAFYLQTWEEKSNSYACMTIQWYFEAWCNRAELAQQEIEKLKAKLAKYESDDVVVVPREPNNDMMEGAYHVLRYEEACSYDIYKAMIEAGEIE